MAIANAEIPVTEKLWLQVSDYYVDNVFNSFYLKPRYHINDQWTIEAEWLHQNRVNNGGNAIDSLSYFRNKFADVIGARAFAEWVREHRRSFPVECLAAPNWRGP